MTTRPRTAGLDALRRQSLRAYHESFTPKLEERDEDQSHILQLELPDFNVQQVRVQVDEPARTVAVAGDRYVGNNRWLRLDKTYPVPQNCMIDKINHKFQDGILTITMPKEPPQQRAAEAAAAPPTETEQPLAENANPIGDSNTSSVEKPADDNDNRKSAVLEKQVSEKIKEDARKQESAKTASENEPTLTPKQEDLIADKKTQDRKINGPDRKPSEKKETEDKIGETEDKIGEKEMEKEEIKRKESETEKKVGDDQDKSKTSSGATTSRFFRAAKLAGGFAIGRLPLPVKANLAVAVVIVAAYFAYTYYQLPTN